LELITLTKLRSSFGLIVQNINSNIKIINWEKSYDIINNNTLNIISSTLSESRLLEIIKNCNIRIHHLNIIECPSSLSNQILNDILSSIIVSLSDFTISKCDMLAIMKIETNILFPGFMITNKEPFLKKALRARRLNISGCKNVEEIIQKLDLQRGSDLEELDISSTNITNEGLHKLIRNNPSIISVKAINCENIKRDIQKFYKIKFIFE
jgi:hypothetical protein